MVRRYCVFACATIVIGYGVIILGDAADSADDRYTQSKKKIGCHG